MDQYAAYMLCGVSLVSIAGLVVQYFKRVAEIDVLQWQLKTAKSDRDWFEERCVRWQQDYHSLTEEMSALKSAPNLEKNKDLRDSLESVLEVSQSVESFRTDF
jgi:hypothetical protein